MRLVLDTNTAVSGLIWGGVPGRLIDAAAAGKTQIISSVPLLDELHDVLFRKKFAAQLAEQGMDAADLFEGYAALVQLVVPAVIGPVILADPDDDIVLATAVACGIGDSEALFGGADRVRFEAGRVGHVGGQDHATRGLDCAGCVECAGIGVLFPTLWSAILRLLRSER